MVGISIVKAIVLVSLVGQGIASSHGNLGNSGIHMQPMKRDAASAAASIQNAVYAIIAALASGLSSAAGLIPKTSTTGQVKWDWSVNKAQGVCLGSWLTLERFMDEDWFLSTGAGANAQDEWTFSQNLGSAAATSALQAHYANFITESDFDVMASHGINSVRIPMGYWAWIATVAGEPYVNAGQVGYLTKAVQWANARGMYVLIDLHGLPGSQNGEESSGHLTSSPSFFNNPTNQARADATVAAVLTWIANNPLRSTISGLEVINEPRPYGASQIQQLSDYYARSYAQIQASAYPVTMFLHPGFVPTPYAYWKPFVQARVTSPPSIVMEDHPYPGNFPPQYDTSDMLNQMCNDAKYYSGYPVPTVITEFGVYTGVKTGTFPNQFYESQFNTWSYSSGMAGSFYWSLRVIPSVAQLAAGLDYSQYSWSYLVAQGDVPSGSSINGNGPNYINSFSALHTC